MVGTGLDTVRGIFDGHQSLGTFSPLNDDKVGFTGVDKGYGSCSDGEAPLSVLALEKRV